jgi:hypothetical protein
VELHAGGTGVDPTQHGGGGDRVDKVLRVGSDEVQAAKLVFAYPGEQKDREDSAYYQGGDRAEGKVLRADQGLPG